MTRCGARPRAQRGSSGSRRRPPTTPGRSRCARTSRHETGATLEGFRALCRRRRQGAARGLGRVRRKPRRPSRLRDDLSASPSPAPDAGAGGRRHGGDHARRGRGHLWRQCGDGLWHGRRGGGAGAGRARRRQGRRDRLRAGAGGARRRAGGASGNPEPARSGVPLVDARAAATPQCRDRGRWRRRARGGAATISRRKGPRDERRRKDARANPVLLVLVVVGAAALASDRLRHASAQPPRLGRAAAAVAGRRRAGARGAVAALGALLLAASFCRRRASAASARSSPPRALLLVLLDERRAVRQRAGRGLAAAARTDARAGLLDREPLRRARRSRCVAAARGRTARCGSAWRRSIAALVLALAASGRLDDLSLVREYAARRGAFLERAGAALRTGGGRAGAGARHRHAARHAGRAPARARGADLRHAQYRPDDSLDRAVRAADRAARRPGARRRRAGAGAHRADALCAAAGGAQHAGRPFSASIPR